MTEAVALPSASTPVPRRKLHAALWIGQILLAALFAMAGTGKTFQPMAALAKQMPWTAQAGAPLVRFIGISELLGAAGLVLPAATRILPVLTPVAAVGLTVVMALAAVFHVAHGELSVLPIPLLLGALGAFIAWGRFAKVPIPKR